MRTRSHTKMRIAVCDTRSCVAGRSSTRLRVSSGTGAILTDWFSVLPLLGRAQPSRHRTPAYHCAAERRPAGLPSNAECRRSARLRFDRRRRMIATSMRGTGTHIRLRSWRDSSWIYTERLRGNTCPSGQSLRSAEPPWFTMLAWYYAARILLFPDRATLAFLPAFVATGPVSGGAAAAALVPGLSTEVVRISR